MDRTPLFLLAALSGACGCASSALVRDDDRTFEHANERFERTITLVEASSASPKERALFLQAEALYRYRFASPGRVGVAFTAEVAAAVTDVPVLQSLASSLDLVDARIRSADAAVQLWETLLHRYPCTPLRSLVLYRLGWAYRSVSISGLPRRSGDEAFDELTRCGGCGVDPSIAGALPDARAVRWKSKDAAATWSLVPGFGQFYVGERLSGAIRFATALAALAAVVAPVAIGAQRPSELTWRHDWPLLAIGVGGLAVLSFDYTTSYEDALRGVVRWNERKEGSFEASHPGAP